MNLINVGIVTFERLCCNIVLTTYVDVSEMGRSLGENIKEGASEMGRNVK